MKKKESARESTAGEAAEPKSPLRPWDAWGPLPKPDKNTPAFDIIRGLNFIIHLVRSSAGDRFESSKPMGEVERRKVRSWVESLNLLPGDYCIFIGHDPDCDKARGGDCSCEYDAVIFSRHDMPVMTTVGNA